MCHNEKSILVTCRGFQGLSIGSARCHDHKLEPITTKDYSGLYSVLKSSKEPDSAPALPQGDTAETREFREKNLKLRGDYATASIAGASAAIHAERSRLGELGDWKAKKQSLCTDLAKVEVKKGGTLDFIVSS